MHGLKETASAIDRHVESGLDKNYDCDISNRIVFTLPLVRLLSHGEKVVDTRCRVQLVFSLVEIPVEKCNFLP